MKSPLPKFDIFVYGALLILFPFLSVSIAFQSPNFNYDLQDSDEESYLTLLNEERNKGGYYSEDYYVLRNLYLVKNDLQVVNISIPTKVYEFRPTNITCKVKSILTVDNVTIHLYEEGDLIENRTISIKNESEIKFLWTPKGMGYTNLSIVLDPYNKIEEEDENNNIGNLKVFVRGLPDIKVDEIFVPSSVKEGEPAFVYAHIENIGHSSTEKCTVSLYLSESSIELQTSELVSKKTISISPLEVVNVTLVWEHALYGNSGRWSIGVEAIPKEGDLDTSNNRLIDFIGVFPEERIPPAIHNIWCEPKEQQKGIPVTFYANISDDTGLQDVNLTIIYPDDKREEFSMSYDKNLFYISLSFNQTGNYSYFVRARDATYIGNENTSEESYFEIFEDLKKPNIEKVWVTPNPQILKENVEIKCIVSDNVRIKTVNIVIIEPDGGRVEEEMNKEEVYFLRSSFDAPGKYTFFIVAEDVSGNKACSNLSSFWITSNLDDTDNDGIPDWWEERYGFDPYDPRDAGTDDDKDGYSLLEEYCSGLNPLKSNTIFAFSPSEFLIVLAIISILLVTVVIYLGKKL